MEIPDEKEFTNLVSDAIKSDVDRALNIYTSKEYMIVTEAGELVYKFPMHKLGKIVVGLGTDTEYGSYILFFPTDTHPYKVEIQNNANFVPYFDLVLEKLDIKHTKTKSGPEQKSSKPLSYINEKIPWITYSFPV